MELAFALTTDKILIEARLSDSPSLAYVNEGHAIVTMTEPQAFSFN